MGVATRPRTSAVDRADVLAVTGGLVFCGGVWRQFGIGWCLMAFGTLLILGALLVAFASSPASPVSLTLGGGERGDPP